MKWLTSGAHRLKASLDRSFGARKNKKAVATRRSTSIFASAKVGARERNTSIQRMSSQPNQRMSSQPIQRMARGGRVLRPSRPMFGNDVTHLATRHIPVLQQELRRQDTHQRQPETKPGRQTEGRRTGVQCGLGVEQNHRVASQQQEEEEGLHADSYERITHQRQQTKPGRQTEGRRTGVKCGLGVEHNHRVASQQQDEEE